MRVSGLSQFREAASETPNASMHMGYAVVSADAPDLSDQLRDLVRAGCGPIFIERGETVAERSERAKALTVLRPGDVLAAARLDCLGDDVSEIIETLETLRAGSIGFLSVAERWSLHGPDRAPARHLVASLAAVARAKPKSEREALDQEPSRPRGASPKLTDADVETAKAMLAEGGHTVAEVAAHLGVSRPTLYRYLPRARAASG